MSTLSQFAGGIKSIQRGTISVTLTSGVGSATATITSVNTSKSTIELLGASQSSNPSYGTYTDSRARVELTNSTTVTAFAAGANSPVVVGYQVVEFY